MWGEKKSDGIAVDFIMASFKLVFFEVFPDEPRFLPFVGPHIRVVWVRDGQTKGPDDKSIPYRLYGPDTLLRLLHH